MFKTCDKCGRLHQEETCPYCFFEDLAQLEDPEEWYGKWQCPECVELDVALQEALNRKPENRYDDELGYIVNRCLTDEEAKQYMCPIHRSLLRAYDHTLCLEFPAEYVLSRVTTSPAVLNYVKVPAKNSEGFEYEPGLRIVDHYDAKCSLEGKIFTLRKAGEQWFAQFEDGEVPVKIGYGKPLENETYIFSTPKIVTEGRFLEDRAHQKREYELIKEHFKKYHAAPSILVLNEKKPPPETNIVRVTCTPTHLTPQGQRCNGTAEYGGAYRVVCEKCRLQVKLWEYGVDYDIG
jgi:hypothetical protein